MSANLEEAVNDIKPITRQEILLAEILNALKADTGSAKSSSVNLNTVEVANIGGYKVYHTAMRSVEYIN